ncbi:hypothetical protein ONE63_011063 [Megalurothrips usitatus]|uniref:Integrase catalytic domain-containing protein n=1 Tax=Megalurothrips usitatus TaxID=439358 RepID=A0AAV7XEY2_9NEOP|nr:hypothetical protein ONE63_011063 [Megalurothrips usitatus]
MTRLKMCLEILLDWKHLVFKLTEAGHTIEEEMLMTKILVILPEQYKHFGVAWDSTPKEERTIDNLRSRLLKEEEKMKGNNNEAKVAFKANKFKDLSRNLLYVNVVTEKGGIGMLDDKSVKFIHGKVICNVDDIVLVGEKQRNGLYTVDLGADEEVMITQKQKAIEWHSKLGHLNFQDLMKIPKLCDGVSDDIEKCNEEFCEPCIRGKLIRKPFNTERARAKRPLEIVHTDICGKISPATPDGEEYIMTCLDDCTHFLKVYLLRTKNEAEEYIKEYINEAEAYFNLKTSKLRLDNGGEYSSNDFKLWCRSRGIQLDYTIPHSPELNGKAERVNLTLFNREPNHYSRYYTSRKVIDQCVFMDPKKKFYVAIHVHDGIIVAKDKKQMIKIIEELKKEFEITVDERPKTYLGMEFKKIEEGILITQSSYVKKIISMYDMEGCQPKCTPISHQENPDKIKKIQQEDLPYQNAVGSLLYLSCKTRPDISYAVNYESRFVKQPTYQDLVNIKRTFRYLNGTQETGILFIGEQPEFS